MSALTISPSRVLQQLTLAKLAYGVIQNPAVITGTSWNPDFLNATFAGTEFQGLYTDLANRYTPVAVLNNASGVSAVAMLEKATGNLYFSVSGTELNAGWSPLLNTTTADLQVGFNVTGIPGSPYYNQYTAVSQFVTNVAASQNVPLSRVYGAAHSLGGYELHDVFHDNGIPLANLTTFSAPGEFGILGTAFDMMTFGMSRPTGDTTQIIFSPDAVPEAGLGQAQVFVIGNVPGFSAIAGHNIDKMTKSLMLSIDASLLASGQGVPTNRAAALNAGETLGVIKTLGGHEIWPQMVNGVVYMVSAKGGNIDGFATVSAADARAGAVPVGLLGELAKQQAQDLTVRKLPSDNLFERVGSNIGSQFGVAIAGENPFAQIAAGTLMGAIGAAFGQWLDYDLAGVQATQGDGIAASFGEQLGASFLATGASVISSTLTNKIMNGLGVDGFGAQLGSVVLNTAIANTIRMGLAKGLISASPSSIWSGLDGNIGAFFGAQLASLVVSPQTQAAAVLGSLASSAGSLIFAKAFGALGYLAGPIGAFVGEILGVLIGNLFGHKKPRIPTATAETYLQIPNASYQLGTITQANGGNVDLVTDMAVAARDALNGLISIATHGAPSVVINPTSPTQIYGHTGGQIYVKLDNVQTNASSATDAVDKGVLWAIPRTQIVGGDIFVKRALYRSVAPNLTVLLADVQAAVDYATYRDDWRNINQLIGANPNSAFTAGWEQSFQRANELQLGKFAPSDFYGGLGGFIDSFDPTKTYEDIQLSWNGSSLQVNVTPGTFNSGLFDALPGASADGRSITIDSFLSGGLSYSAWSGSTGMGGNNFINAAGATSGQSIDDFGTADGSFGGDDIAVGSAYNDFMQGRTGRDWLDGGGGNDVIHGGKDQDVLLGGAGDDTLYGDAGDDYLAGGAGNDVHFGGDGNDTFSGKGGNDTMSGDAGDDVFIINADGGSTLDSMDGGAGNDTLSYERFGTAVTLNLASTSYYGDVWTSIENVTGGQADDQMTGTAGDNVLRGMDGSDTLNSGAGGHDVLEGGQGADLLIGDAAADVTASYAHSVNGVFIDLTAQSNRGGDAEGDTLSGVRNLTGSQNDDQLQGDGFTNRLSGLAGDDRLVASAGSDSYDGGDGKDFVDYSGASGSVTLYLGSYTGTTWTAGSGSGGLAAGQTYINVEGVIGSGYGDNLSSGDGAQVLIGGQGNDTLAGGAGADTYVFNRGDGSDVVNEDTTGWNTLTFGDTVLFQDLVIGTLGGPNGYLDFYIRGTSDKVRIAGDWANANLPKLKSLDLGGGNKLDLDLALNAPASSDGNDTLVGADGYGDLLFGANGDDLLKTRASGLDQVSHVFVGGLGNDTLNASTGDDTFGFDRDGSLLSGQVQQDYIVDGGGEDTLVFGPSVAADDVLYEVVNGSLYIGARDPTNPNLTASQVANRVLVQDGGSKYHDLNTDTYYFAGNMVEFVVAGGQTIDLRNLNLPWNVVPTVNYVPTPPIVFDLDGDGLDLTTWDESRVVAKTANGAVSKLGWIGPREGILAFDRDGDGSINKLSEISFTQDKPGATSDLEGLIAWDTNGDGVLDSADKDWSKLQVWVDRNQNGRSTPGELRTLAQAGITSINLKGNPTGYSAAVTSESYIRNTLSYTTRDGKGGTAYDVALSRRLINSQGLYAGPAQTSWGDLGGDAELGRVLNDPTGDALQTAGRTYDPSQPLNLRGLSYDAVVAAAKLDFSNTDGLDPVIAKLWENQLDPTKYLSWLQRQNPRATSQASIDALVAKPASADRPSGGSKKVAAPAASLEGSSSLEAQALGQGSGAMQIAPIDPVAVGSEASQVVAPALVGEDPLIAPLPAEVPVSSVAATAQGWWRTDAPQSLGYMDDGIQTGRGLVYDGIVAAAATSSVAADGRSIHEVRQQQLLRQAMAGFGGDAGSSAAVWNRNLQPSNEGSLVRGGEGHGRTLHQAAA